MSSAPQNFDAVLGGQPLPLTALVLGGLEGLRQRFASPLAGQRLTAIATAQTYGTVGLDLVITALHDPDLEVRRAAYRKLQTWPAPEADAALQQYDPYPLFTNLITLTGHRGGITAIALSPDGETLASGSRDCTLRIWDWQSQEAIWEFWVDRLIYAIAFSPDGQVIALRDQHQQVQAWYLRNGQPIEPEELLTLRRIPSVALSQVRTHRHLISGSQNTIKIWDLQQGRELCTLQGHTSLVTAIAVQPLELLVSGSEDWTVKVWGVGE
jgi:WD domain, G-beta repeat